MMTLYEFGYDAGKNGSNTENSHFSHFSTQAKMKEWQRGYDDGKAACVRDSSGAKRSRSYETEPANSPAEGNAQNI